MTTREADLLRMAMHMKFREARVSAGVTGVVINGAQVIETNAGQFAIDRGVTIPREYANTIKGALSLLMVESADWKKEVLTIERLSTARRSGDYE